MILDNENPHAHKSYELIPKTPDSQLIASQSYRDKMIKAGFKQIALWVPAEKAEQVKKYAKQLRKNEGL